MQFLSLSRRKVAEFGEAAFTPELAAAEAQRVREMYVEGTLRQVWRRGDTAGAAIVWEAADEATVRAALESLPLNRAGLLEITALVPLAPYSGFGPRG
jgi:muconolactone delta-isomerase